MGLVCVCLGCTADASKVVDHPEHGERVVCEDCSGEMEIVSHV